MNHALLRLSYFVILYGLLTFSHAMELGKQTPTGKTSQTTQIAE